MGSVSIPLHSRKYPGLFALVDEEDYRLVSKHRWFPERANTSRENFYAISWIRIDRTWNRRPMHRLLLNAASGVLVDHRDGNGLNNRRTNIRVATTKQNGANRRKQTKATTSRYKGVTLHCQTQRWQAQISVNGLRIYLGLYEREEDAAHAYDLRAREYFGEFALINFEEGK